MDYGRWTMDVSAKNMNVDNEPQIAPRCIHLRCKSMMVYGEAFEEDPEYQSGAIDWWCTLTMTPNGPDGSAVSMDCCRNPERTCWREY
jgi:hypothetical protein